MNFSITGKENIKKFGFGYIENRQECQVHRFNEIPVQIKLTKTKHVDFGRVDDDINTILKSILKKELKGAGVQKIHSIEWDRVFVFDSFLHGEEDLKKFTVRFWIRIYGEKGMNEGVSVIGGK